MTQEMTYEQAMSKLEELAQKMEQNEIGIDELAEKLKEAKSLLEFCKNRLYLADSEVQMILNSEEK